MTTLITGGCGYIGSHVARLMTDQGAPVVILDNFSTGFRRLLANGATLVEGDCRNQAFVEEVFSKYNIEQVIHFAASIIVSESVVKPIEYYENNLISTLNLVRAARKFKLKNFLFSSTAAVYGDADSDFVDETASMNPQSPYGKSKVANEWMLRDAAEAHGFKYVILRYFNVAGAKPDLSIGPLTPNATHLIRVASEVAVGKRPAMSIYGTDYKTPDGTAIRDYIHIEDIAQAHIDCLAYLNRGGQSSIFNCGYGKGYSVREVLTAFSKVLGRPLKFDEKPRRGGDVERIVANPDKIRKIVGWRPKFDSLEEIICSAIQWEKKNL